VSLPLEAAAGAASPQAGGGLPVVNQALEPEWVRHGSAATQKAYTSALAFEQTLVEQLSQSLAATGGIDGEGSAEGEGSEEGGGTASNSQLSSMLPQALSAGVMHAGGLGLAAQLTRDMEAQSSHAGSVSAGGGTVAPVAGTGEAAGTTGTSSSGGSVA
jgi:Rod binding domain-containing protein